MEERRDKIAAFACCMKGLTVEQWKLSNTQPGILGPQKRNFEIRLLPLKRGTLSVNINLQKTIEKRETKNEQIAHLDGGGGLSLDGRGRVECFHVSQQLQNSKVAGIVRKVMVTVVKNRTEFPFISLTRKT